MSSGTKRSSLSTTVFESAHDRNTDQNKRIERLSLIETPPILAVTDTAIVSGDAGTTLASYRFA
ncbi:hypothetical protein CWI69_00275 [Pseudidiomarina halophila]|uniref:Uncharacterized protein n=1 Tax=Pseudidiomarina halophila TaxID=1449799 RepID=A0A432XZ46_9GAMM|nr:hypothetical protein CWI69_00275 [Pseudidiomarina halophila]